MLWQSFSTHRPSLPYTERVRSISSFPKLKTKFGLTSVVKGIKFPRTLYTRTARPAITPDLLGQLGVTVAVRLHSTSCGDRRRRQFMNWTATCVAKIAHSGYAYKRSHLIALRTAKITA